MLGDRLFSSGVGSSRSCALGRSGAACTAHPLATLTAYDVLRGGGNSLDAAIAANAMLGVVEPTGCGVGGDLFAIVRTADGSVHGLNASGRSSSAMTVEQMRAASGTVPAYGPLSVTVPGCVDGWETLHKRFGSLPMDRILRPAIECARNGFPVSEVIAGHWKAGMDNFERQRRVIGDEYVDRAKAVYLRNGRAPEAGEVFANPALAATLDTIAREGAAAFYGRVLQPFAHFTQSDFATHCGSSQWVDPIKCAYRDATVYELPPNTQGIAALLMLRILDGWPDLASMPLADAVHVQVEAKRLAYADMERYVGDDANVEHLLDERYVSRLRKRIRLDRALSENEVAAAGPDAKRLPADTTYLTVAHNGMMVSLIQSNFRGFGSGVVLPDTGFMLQNRGELFSLHDGHPNVYAPRKRPFHTIIPAFAQLGDGSLLSFGLMGGDMQAQGHAQMMHALVDRGVNVQQAGDAPRWHHGDGVLHLESALLGNAALCDSLRRRGHTVAAGTPGTFGGYQAIWVDCNGVYWTGSDMRKDGCGMAF